MASAAFLKECNVFEGLNDAQIEKLAAIAKEEAYPTGALLYKEGDPSTHLYLVQQGKVFLEMKCDMGPTRPPMQVIIDVVTRREAFGWSAFVGAQSPHPERSHCRADQDDCLRGRQDEGPDGGGLPDGFRNHEGAHQAARLEAQSHPGAAHRREGPGDPDVEHGIRLKKGEGL